MNLSQKIVEICRENEYYAVVILNAPEWEQWRRNNPECLSDILAIANKVKRPEEIPVGVADFSELRKVCRQYVELVNGGCETSNARQFIFEAAIEALYGEDAWDWINSKLP